MSRYSEQLKDPRWQEMRLKVLKRDKYRCRHCLATDKPLHVHHLVYLKNHAPWDYARRLLVTFCADCHNLAHTGKVLALHDVRRGTRASGTNPRALGTNPKALRKRGKA